MADQVVSFTVVVFDDPFSHDDFRIFSVDFRITDFLSYFRINPDKSGWLAALGYAKSPEFSPALVSVATNLR